MADSVIPQAGTLANSLYTPQLDHLARSARIPPDIGAGSPSVHHLFTYALPSCICYVFFRFRNILRSSPNTEGGAKIVEVEQNNRRMGNCLLEFLMVKALREGRLVQGCVFKSRLLPMSASAICRGWQTRELALDAIIAVMLIQLKHSYLQRIPEPPSVDGSRTPRRRTDRACAASSGFMTAPHPHPPQELHLRQLHVSPLPPTPGTKSQRCTASLFWCFPYFLTGRPKSDETVVD